MTKPKILVLAGSLRRGSYNRALAHAATAALEEAGGDVTHIDLRDYPLALYDADLEADEGLPDSARQLHRIFSGHQGVFLASPEYNANVTPLMLNMLAWVSRVTDDGGMQAAFGEPVFALGSASPGGFGGYRGLVALRQVLELQLGARILPAMIAVATAHEAFDEANKLRPPRLTETLERISAQLIAANST